MKVNIEYARESLNKVLLLNSAVVQKAAERVLKREIYFNLNRQDQLRLLNLRYWADKYKIDMVEVLALLLPIWNKKFKHSKGLGVRISTLVGQKSKEILVDYIKRVYPNGENIVLYKEKLVRSMSLIEIKYFAGSEDPFNLVSDYKEYLHSVQKEDSEQQIKLSRRKFRNNPVI